MNFCGSFEKNHQSVAKIDNFINSIIKFNLSFFNKLDEKIKNKILKFISLSIINNTLSQQ